MLVIAVLFMLFAVPVFAQAPTPSQAQQDTWVKESTTLPFERQSCGALTWVVGQGRVDVKSTIGWYARGFVVGALYIVGPKTDTLPRDFGLSTDVASAHVLAYCATHQTSTTEDAVQDLLLTVLKTAKTDK